MEAIEWWWWHSTIVNNTFSFVNSMKRLMIKRLHFADSIERRLIFSEQLLLFSTKRLSIRSNTTDWYGQEQPNVWSLWTGKHSPMLLVFESPINQMVHLQFYDNCELSQVGKELGGKKKRKKMGCTDCFISVKSANVIFPLVCHKFLHPKSSHAQL